MAYTTTDNIESKLGITLTADQIQYFNDVLSDGIDDYINFVTNTMFGSTEEVSIYVSGEGTNQIIIPTMHTITAIKTLSEDGTESPVSNDAYYFYPRGEDRVYAIKNKSGIWPEGFDNIKVTGALGYPEVPLDIVKVATEMAVTDFNSNVTGLKSEKVGDWAATYAEGDTPLSAQSNSTLKRYTRLSRRI